VTVSEELKIIGDVLNGDTDAFEALVLDNQRKVYHLALKITGNEDDAQDIAQEAFIRAYAGLRSFRGDSRFSVWLYRLVYNLCIDFTRKKQRVTVTSLTAVDEDGEQSDIEIPDLRYAPEGVAEKRELREAVARGIDALPPKHREILVMREVTGLSYEDIGRTLGISEGTVKSRLSRARLRLAALLPQYGTFYAEHRHNGMEEVKERG
jgi:RNA polymerase sigma-70 factor (ECF subfamily)